MAPDTKQVMEAVLLCFPSHPRQTAPPTPEPQRQPSGGDGWWWLVKHRRRGFCFVFWKRMETEMSRKELCGFWFLFFFSSTDKHEAIMYTHAAHHRCAGNDRRCTVNRKHVSEKEVTPRWRVISGTREWEGRGRPSLGQSPPAFKRRRRRKKLLTTSQCWSHSGLQYPGHGFTFHLIRLRFAGVC